MVGSDRVVRLKKGGSVSDTNIISGTYGIYEEGTSDRATVIDDNTTVQGGTDVGVRIAPGAGETHLSDVRLFADTAILDEGADLDAGSFRLERGNLVGYTAAINVDGTRPIVANTVIAPGSGGVAVYARGGARVTVDQSTLKGVGGDGILTEDAGSHVDVSNSIVRGFARDLNGWNATGIAADHSDFVTHQGTLTFGTGNTDADPDFVSNSDRLRYDSPLIDAGSGNALRSGETDFGHHERIVDGDGDGTATRDIGAYEYRYVQPKAKIVADATTVAPGTAVNFDASGSTLYSDARYEWDLDGDGTFETHTGSTPHTSRSYDTPGPHAVSVLIATSDDPSSTATVTVTVRAPATTAQGGSGQEQQQDSPQEMQQPQDTQQPAGPATPPVRGPVITPSALKLGLTGTTLRLDRRGRGTIAVSCSLRPCNVRLAVTTPGAHPRTLARVSGPAGRLRVKLSRSYLKKHRVRSVVVKAASAGAAATRTLKVR